jgi:hypothetical protein
VWVFSPPTISLDIHAALDRSWTIEGGKKEDMNKIIETTTFVTPTTVAFKLFIARPYFDAGYGKYTDPLRGWTLDAHPPRR